MLFKTLIFMISFLLFFQCSNSTDSNSVKNDFGIYLLKNTSLTTFDAKEKTLNTLEIQDQPIINLEDIVSYDWSTHKIALQQEAFDRIKKFDSANISIYGLPFVVLVDQQKIYLGNIYPMYSSLFHMDLPSIYVAPFLEMKIYRPSDEFEDKRSDERIYRVLEINKKLKK